jgi:hypothetical protein
MHCYVLLTIPLTPLVVSAIDDDLFTLAVVPGERLGIQAHGE